MECSYVTPDLKKKKRTIVLPTAIKHAVGSAGASNHDPEFGWLLPFPGKSDAERWGGCFLSSPIHFLHWWRCTDTENRVREEPNQCPHRNNLYIWLWFLHITNPTVLLHVSLNNHSILELFPVNDELGQPLVIAKFRCSIVWWCHC